MKQVTIPAQWLQELIALCGPEDHELRERVMKSAAPAPVDALATGGQAQAVDIAELVTGMSVSVDVSTGDDDAGNRYFGTVTVAQEDPHDKHGLTLLVQDAKPNFTPQAQEDARDAEQERWMGIGKAIERACVDLPAGAEINIHLEKDAGTVTLSDCDGDEQENFPTDEGFAGVVNAAIDAAIAAAKGE